MRFQEVIKMVQNYKQLKIWKRSFQLAIEIYKLTNKFPKSEKYNLTAQLRRADTSISSNIAEGASKHTSVDFQRYLYQAYGSLKEVESQLLLSKELKYVLVRDFQPLEKEIDEIARMIYRFIEVVKKN
jgi:four helix bundle protein